MTCLQVGTLFSGKLSSRGMITSLLHHDYNIPTPSRHLSPQDTPHLQGISPRLFGAFPPSSSHLILPQRINHVTEILEPATSLVTPHFPPSSGMRYGLIVVNKAFFILVGAQAVFYFELSDTFAA